MGEKRGEEGGKDRVLKPESPVISCFVPHVNQSGCIRDSADASVGA